MIRSSAVTVNVDFATELELVGLDGKADWMEIELEVEASYTPVRLPVACSDHDHPEFSNPGSDEEIEIEWMRLNGAPWTGKLDAADTALLNEMIRKTGNDLIEDGGY